MTSSLRHSSSKSGQKRIKQVGRRASSISMSPTFTNQWVHWAGDRCGVHGFMTLYIVHARNTLSETSKIEYVCPNISLLLATRNLTVQRYSSPFHGMFLSCNPSSLICLRSSAERKLKNPMLACRQTLSTASKIKKIDPTDQKTQFLHGYKPTYE